MGVKCRPVPLTSELRSVRFGEREHNDILRRFHAFVEPRAPCSFERMVKLYVNIMLPNFVLTIPA